MEPDVSETPPHRGRGREATLARPPDGTSSGGVRRSTIRSGRGVLVAESEAALATRRQNSATKKRCCGPCRRCFHGIHSCFCAPGSHVQRCLSMTLWSQRLTGWLDRCVSRSVVVSFTICELLISSLCVSVFLFHSEVALLGFIIRSGFLLIVICLCRAVSALLGTFSAWMRKVGRMRYYWILMCINGPASLFVIIPLGTASCNCRDTCSKDQHDVLKTFLAESEGVHMPTTFAGPLAGFFSAGAGPARGPAAAGDAGESHPALARRLGGEPPPTAASWWDALFGPSEPEQERQALDLFNVTEAGIAFRPTADDSSPHLEDSLRCYKAEAFALDKDAHADVRQQLTKLQCGGEGGVGTLKNEFIQERITKCASLPTCLAVEVKLGKTFVRVCGLDGGDGGKLLPTLDTKALDSARTCKRYPDDCDTNAGAPKERFYEERTTAAGKVVAAYVHVGDSVVKGQDLVKVILPDGSSVKVLADHAGKVVESFVTDDGDQQVTAGQLVMRLSTFEAEDMPEECLSFSVFFYKMSQAGYYSLEDDDAELHCKAMLYTSCFLVCLLDFLEMFMVIVVIKFIQNHCGDFIPTQEKDPMHDQWSVPVEDTLEHLDSDGDDFHVGSWVSLTGLQSQHPSGGKVGKSKTEADRKIRDGLEPGRGSRSAPDRSDASASGHTSSDGMRGFPSQWGGGPIGPSPGVVELAESGGMSAAVKGFMSSVGVAAASVAPADAAPPAQRPSQAGPSLGMEYLDAQFEPDFSVQDSVAEPASGGGWFPWR